MKRFLPLLLLITTDPALGAARPGPEAKAARELFRAGQREQAFAPCALPPGQGEDLGRLLNNFATLVPDWSYPAHSFVSPSGRLQKNVSCSSEQCQQARALLCRLAGLTRDARADEIRREMALRPLTEVDLWLPASILKRVDPKEATRIVEAWQQLATFVDRRDIVLAAVSAGLDLAIPREGLDQLRAAGSSWARKADTEPASEGKAHLIRSYAEILLRFGRDGAHNEALASYEASRDMSRQIGDTHGEARAQVGAGETLLRLGRYEGALIAFREARQIAAPSGYLGEVGNAWRGEADYLLRLGQNRQALQAYRLAQESHRIAGAKAGEGYDWAGEGEVLLRQRQYSEATTAYRRAGELLAAAGMTNGEGTALKGEADVFYSLGKMEAAIDLYRQARSRFRLAKSQHGEGSSLLGEARAQTSLQNWGKARSTAEEAALALESRDLILDQIQAVLLIANASQQLGDTERAASNARKAISLHTLRRSSWITDLHRTVFDQPISRAYEILIPLLARNPNQAEEALSRAEEGRSRVLLDLLATSSPTSGSMVGNEVRIRELRVALAQIGEQLTQASNPQLRLDLASQRAGLDRELEWTSYEIAAARESSLVTAIPLDAGAIRELAGETGPILLYYCASSEIVVFFIPPPPAPLMVRVIPADLSHLEVQISDLVHFLSNPIHEQRANALRREIWNTLIAPFETELPPSGRLVILPHGPLHELPFEALIDHAGVPLFQHWNVSIAPSASALALARRRHLSARKNDRFVAFSSGLHLGLPETEIREIARLFNDGPFEPTEARFEAWERRVPQARHLLIAGRGYHTQGSSRDTYIEILPSQDHDRRLSAAEIAAIPLRTELAAFAACDISHGSALLSDERLDLTRAFLIAGAAAVLATRWKVPEDNRTSRFMIDFYSAYRQGGLDGKGMRKDEALTEARRRAWKRGDPAQVWAAWVLVGDSR